MNLSTIRISCRSSTLALFAARFLLAFEHLYSFLLNARSICLFGQFTCSFFSINNYPFHVCCNMVKNTLYSSIDQSVEQLQPVYSCFCCYFFSLFRGIFRAHFFTLPLSLSTSISPSLSLYLCYLLISWSLTTSMQAEQMKYKYK